MKRYLMTLVICLVSLPAVAAWEALPAKAPAPADNLTTPAKIELGKKLFFDARLSRTGTVSCNSCHNVMLGGVDLRPTSHGILGQKGGRNAPTVWNSAFNSVQFWDGRAASLEDQAKGPPTNPIEMGMASHDAVVDVIKKVPGYVKEFEAVFGKNSITMDNAVKAIAAYERTLITPDSPYDRYVKGDKKALSAAAVRGMKRAEAIGCTSCHMGPNFTGPGGLPVGTGFYQKFPRYPGSVYDKKYHLLSDAGRAEVTKNEADQNSFRVQTWRNVAHTAPYFHNGSVQTLDEAVRVMAKTQLQMDLADNDVADLVAFLNSLTGKYPKQVLPELPATDGTTLISE